VNTVKNWGNTIIIKHTEGLFSKLCHLQKGSVAVKAGDNVHQGQIIAKVGNSGRSPYPHIHFQLQPTPYIGSKTIHYPLFAYILEGKEVKTFSFPEKEQRIMSLEENSFLKKSFNLMPGAKLKWNIKSPKGESKVMWEVMTNSYNVSYIYCHTTRSIAHFKNDGVHFYFTYFDGDRTSLLYYFYMASFRIPLFHMEQNITSDTLPVNQTFSGYRLFLHDLSAPFFMYLKACLQVRTDITGSQFDIDQYNYHSKLAGYSFNRLIWEKEFLLSVRKDNSLIFKNFGQKLEAICEPY
jgi:hypothetical protein